MFQSLFEIEIFFYQLFTYNKKKLPKSRIEYEFRIGTGTKTVHSLFNYLRKKLHINLENECRKNGTKMVFRSAV